jgi:GcrA cell cycle regulator
MRRGQHALPWNDARAKRMADLWLDGLSASQVSERMGIAGITRNAVIGKVHRLKLFRGENPRPAPKPPVRKPRKRPKRLPSRLLSASISSLIPDEGIEIVPSSPPVQHMVREEQLVPSESNPVLIFALTDAVCRWPLWDIDDDLGVEDKLYCGALTAGDTYCSHHRAMASQHDYSHSERAAYRAKQRAGATA